MSYVFEPIQVACLPIHGEQNQFPVRRVYCVGRNYAAHVREMGFDPDRDPPFFFCKPNDRDSIVPVEPGKSVSIPYPPGTKNYHFEGELIVVIGKEGFDISPEDAQEYVYGYAVGLDMTRRDLQMVMRDKGRPWEAGKVSDFSAPIGPIYKASDIGPLNSGEIKLTVNGETKQKSDLTKLIWSVPEVISYLSKLFVLKPGDIVFTGTPEGVASVVPGDVIKVSIDKIGDISVTIR